MRAINAYSISSPQLHNPFKRIDFISFHSYGHNYIHNELLAHLSRLPIANISFIYSMEIEPILLPRSIDLGSSVVVESIEFAVRVDAPGLGFLSRVVFVPYAGEFHLYNRYLA